jgi:SRSO17 transposase
VQAKDPSHHGPGTPTDRRYWLIITQEPHTGEIRYIVSNAPAYVSLPKLLEVVFARWHVEKWFERAKQEAGLGAFEVRTYTGLIRHWLSCRLGMLFLSRQTARLREKNPQITFEQVALVTNASAWSLWNRFPHSRRELLLRCTYYQRRNEASYASRRRHAK